MPNPYDADSAGLAQRQRHIITMPLHQPNPALQPALIGGQEQPVTLTIEERFRRFHAANPHIFLALRDMALAQARAGAHRISPKLLVEQLRASGVTSTGEEFVVDNRFTSRYARLLASIPELSGRIPMKRLQAE